MELDPKALALFTEGYQKIIQGIGQLGFDISEPPVSRYLKVLKRRTDGDRAKRWMAFLHNHREVIAAFDFFFCG